MSSRSLPSFWWKMLYLFWFSFMLPWIQMKLFLTCNIKLCSSHTPVVTDETILLLCFEIFDELIFSLFFINLLIELFKIKYIWEKNCLLSVFISTTGVIRDTLHKTVFASHHIRHRWNYFFHYALKYLMHYLFHSFHKPCHCVLWNNV